MWEGGFPHTEACAQGHAEGNCRGHAVCTRSRVCRACRCQAGSSPSVHGVPEPWEKEFVFGGSEVGAQDCNPQPTAAWATEGVMPGTLVGSGACAAHFDKDTKTSGTEVRDAGTAFEGGTAVLREGGRCCIWASLPLVNYEGDKEGRL